MTSHFLVEVAVRYHDRDHLALDLWAAGATGIEERADTLVACFVDAHAAHSTAADLGGDVEIVAEEWHNIWRDRWRAHATVIEAGPFSVHPPWLDPREDRLAVGIDSGNAFGTGSHPSTRLALRLLADVVRAGDHVVDVGSGSGVLSVAAARLGATVEAVDTDASAVAATTANAAANAVEAAVVARHGSVEDAQGPVDVVAVNVTVDIHERVAPGVRSLRPRTVVGSGILHHQADRLVAAYGGAVSEQLTEGEWVAVRLDL